MSNVLEIKDINIVNSPIKEPLLFKKPSINNQNQSPSKKRTLSSKENSYRGFLTRKILGSGKFGDVLQCKHKRTGTIYAIKKIFKSTIK